jgi:polysaccharide export outer membrane protein
MPAAKTCLRVYAKTCALLVAAALVLASCQHRSATVASPVTPRAARGATLDQLAYEGGGAQAYAETAPEAYRLDSGDRLRIVVFGQDGLTNSYSVDAGGSITMPLIGGVRARGMTPPELSRAVAAKLRQGYIREPHVAVEIESYRPFFILGEVAAPGQYPYVPNMTVESAVAIAGGFSPRAQRHGVELSRPAPGGMVRAQVPVTTLLKPGDTVIVGERWF